MQFDSHVAQQLEAAVRLVNLVTAGHDGGRPRQRPTGEALVAAVRGALTRQDYRPRVSTQDARVLGDLAEAVRQVFEAVDAGEVAAAAALVNDLLAASAARPRLDFFADSGWSLHFHGSSDRLAPGWSAGIAAGLALAVGSDGVGRLGVCGAPGCDRVYVDASKNRTRRFCSTRCQNRVKAAAHRRRGTGSAGA